MDNLRQLLVAIAALTLVFSIVSGANPNYFAGYVAHADDDEDEEDDNSGSSNYEEEDHDESARHDKDDDDDDEHTVAAEFGSSSIVKLEIDDEIEDDQGNARAVEADLEIETEDEDLDNGEHDVSLTCDTPDFEKEFDEPLKVDDGKGKFEQLLAFVNGTTYEDCVVAIGDTDVELPKFTVIVTEEEDDIEDDDTGRDEEDDDDQRENREHKTELEIEDGKVEIEVKVTTRLADGTYDAQLTCEEPEIDMTIEDGFKVEDGEGELEAELELARGMYKGCELESENVVIATFDSFAVRQGQEDDDDDEEEDDDDRSVEEKRKEKRKEIISKIRAIDEHKRRVNANPASTGDYKPGWNYTLTASGTGTPREDVDIDALLEGSISADAIMEGEADVEVEMDMGVWKSNKALVLLSILDGTVEVDDKTYTVELGFGLYSVSHDAMRLAAFVSDEDGNIYKLKLRGTAEDGSGFPTKSGDSIDMVFEGNSGPARNSFDHWHLDLEGTVEAE